MATEIEASKTMTTFKTPSIQGETDSRYRELPRLSPSKSYRELLIANSDLSLIFSRRILLLVFVSNASCSARAFSENRKR